MIKLTIDVDVPAQPMSMANPRYNETCRAALLKTGTATNDQCMNGARWYVKSGVGAIIPLCRTHANKAWRDSALTIWCVTPDVAPEGGEEVEGD